MNHALQNLLWPAHLVPAEHRPNIRHIYLENIWFAVLNSSTASFLGVYLARLGATPAQVGLFIAMPAVLNLLLTLPAGAWAQRFPVMKITPRVTALTRAFCLLFVPLAWIFKEQQQIWAIILIVLVMNISGTVMAVLTNAFIGEVIHCECRAQVIGVRNALLAAVSIVASLGVGQILTRIPFPAGYQVMFAIGVVGAVMSSYHQLMMRPVAGAGPAPALPGCDDPALQALAVIARPSLRIELLKGRYARFLAVIAFYYFAIFYLAPLFPLYQVNVLRFSDQTISIGASLYWVVQLVVSFQAGKLARRIHFRGLTGWGMVSSATAMLVFMFSYSLPVYAFCQLFSGSGWAMMNVGLVNYLLEQMPDNDRPAHLTWYNLVLNAATLAGSLVAPLVAGWTGLFWAMAFAVAFRFFSGMLILKKG